MPACSRRSDESLADFCSTGRKMTHTTGPWCFEAENGRAHPRVYGADNSLIAEVGNANLMRWEVWDHDARLIAAAPDLASALRGILDNNDTHGSSLDQTLIGNARAALAKATGK